MRSQEEILIVAKTRARFLTWQGFEKFVEREMAIDKTLNYTETEEEEENSDSIQQL